MGLSAILWGLRTVIWTAFTAQPITETSGFTYFMVVTSSFLFLVWNVVDEVTGSKTLPYSSASYAGPVVSGVVSGIGVVRFAVLRTASTALAKTVISGFSYFMVFPPFVSLESV